jgi:hypothetical protein
MRAGGCGWASIRFEKLRKLIAESSCTIHDLSRIEVSKDALPRFNMPFEPGPAMGAKYVGSPRQRRSSALILVRKDYILNAYLSDLGGNDPSSHNGDPLQLMAAVTRFLHTSPTGKMLAGPEASSFASYASGKACCQWQVRFSETCKRCILSETIASTLR